MLYASALIPFGVAATTKPSCWAVLPQGNQMTVIAAVEDRLYVLDAFEAVQQVSQYLIVLKYVSTCITEHHTVNNMQKGKSCSLG